MEKRVKHLYEFGQFRFYPDEGLLLRNGQPVSLAPKVTDTLSVLVQNSGSLVTKDELMRRVWPDSYVEEGNLNKNIFVLRKALGLRENGEEYIDTVPKRGYRFAVPVNETTETPATPQTNGTDIWASRTRRDWQHPGITSVLGLSLAMAVILLTYWVRFRGSSDSSSIHSLAVLPLQNLSGDSVQDYFADGMTEELITELGRIRSLRVISRTSAFQYRGANKPLRQIAREMNVDAIVEGTVLRSGDQVRITAQLIQASAQEKQLWAHSYQANLKDIFGVQREIANAIARQVRMQLAPRERSPVGSESINPAAYELYLKGEYFSNRMTPDSTQKAADYFQRAIELDPNYVAALTKLAGCYGILGNMQVVPKNVSNPKASALISKALEIDPQFGPAHAVRGWGLLQYDLNFAAAGAEFQRAAELAPNGVESHEGLGTYYATVGQVQPAVQEMEKARALDPVGQIVNYDLCLMLYFARRYDEAIAQCKASLDVEPQSVGALWQLGAVYAARGSESEAVIAFLKADELSGLPAAMVAALRKQQKRSGLSEFFKASVEFPGLKIEDGQVDQVRLAEAYTFAGQMDKAVLWLERAFESRAYGITYIAVNPTFDPLRSDPRFIALVQRVGLKPSSSMN